MKSDLLYSLIKSGLSNDRTRFRFVVASICSNEKEKKNSSLAEKIEKLLYNNENNSALKNAAKDFLIEKDPVIKMSSLMLPSVAMRTCNDLIYEHKGRDLLVAHNLEPRSKLLLTGPPGNGKTSLAESIAESLELPFFVVNYECLFCSLMGQTASNISKIFNYVKNEKCVLLIDEFETVAKERDDSHDVGEAKRVLSHLLLQIDSLPSSVILIAATNHESMVDRAMWRRFQIKINLPMPHRNSVDIWWKEIQHRMGVDMGFDSCDVANMLIGMSYAELEEFAVSIYRKHVLNPDVPISLIAKEEFDLIKNGLKNL